MKTPLLIAIVLTTLMLVVHVGLFWWFVLRQSNKAQPKDPPGGEDEGKK